MTTISDQAYGIMDMNNSDDEMQINSDMVAPHNVDFSEEDFMRDASAEPEQDLMNQDPIDIKNPERDDDMLDEDIADQGSLVMADDVDIDVDRAIGQTIEDEDIIYEDEDEPVNLNDHDQTSQQTLEAVDYPTTEQQAAPHLLVHPSLQGVEHLDQGGERDAIETDIAGTDEPQESPEIQSTGAQTVSTSSAVNDTISSAEEPSNLVQGEVGPNTNKKVDSAEGATEYKNSNFDAVEDPELDEGSEQPKFNLDRITLGHDTDRTTISDKEIIDNGIEPGLHIANDDQNKNLIPSTNTGNDGAGESACHGDDVQESGLSYQDVNVPQQVLHPVKIHYAQAEFSLFPPHEDDESDFFVENESLAFQSLDKLLSACRDVLEGSIGDHDEVVLDIPGLGLHISEGSVYAHQISLAQVLDVYLTLHRNDQVDNVAPLNCELRTRICLGSQYNFLQQAAQGGKGMSEIPIALQTLPSRPGIGEITSHDLVSAQDAQHNDEAQATPQSDETGANETVSRDAEASVGQNEDGAGLAISEQVEEDTSGSRLQTTDSHDADENVDNLLYDDKYLDVAHGEVEYAEVFKGVNVVNEPADEAEEGKLPSTQHPETNFTAPLQRDSDNQILMDLETGLTDSVDLANERLTEQPHLLDERRDDNYSLVGGANVNTDADQQVESVGLTEDKNNPQPVMSRSHAPLRMNKEPHLSLDEDLFDSGNTNVSKEPKYKQFHSQATLADELTKHSIETTGSPSKNLLPEDHFADTHNDKKIAGQNERNGKAKTPNGEVNSVENLVGSNEQYIEQIADEDTELHEDNLESITGKDDEVEDDVEGAGPLLNEKSNVNAFDLSETGYQENAVDEVDFNFVQPKGDGSYKEPIHQVESSQAFEEGEFDASNDPSFNSTPTSSKRKAHDTEDDAEISQSVTSETKRSRTS